MSPFRILSIDGGGIRGYLAAVALAELERYINLATNSDKALGLRFDLVAGTSTGSLIAFWLGLARPASALPKLYTDFARQVFGKSNRRAFLLQPFRPKYRNSGLTEVMRNTFANLTLQDLAVDVCVTAVSLIVGRPRLYKTDYFTRNSDRLATTLLDAAMGSTAAPTYLNAHSQPDSLDIIDGGLCANNPAMVALVDALQFERPSKRGTLKPLLHDTLGKPPVVLSMGTGQFMTPPYNPNALVNGGWWSWRNAAHEVLISAQSASVDEQIRFLLGSRYCRIDPVLPTRVELDDVASMDALAPHAKLSTNTFAFADKFLCE